MTTERAAALTDTASAGVEADPDLNPSDRPETDQPGAKAAADPTPAIAMRRNRNPSAETQRLYAADWRAFEDWCREQSLIPLTAEATTVAAFLTQGAKTLALDMAMYPCCIRGRHPKLSAFPLEGRKSVVFPGRRSRRRELLDVARFARCHLASLCPFSAYQSTSN